MSDFSNFDLNLLRVFRALMNDLNATRAAERLGVSQAAVSASLKRLRLAFGDPLFERTQRGLKPTARAVVAARQIEEALALVDKTLGVGSVEPAAVIRLGLSDDFEIAFGARIMARMQEARPEVRLVFRQTNSQMATENLVNREIDLAITSGSIVDSRLRHRSLGSSDYLAVYDPLVRGSTAPLSIEEYTTRDHILISYSGLTGVTDDVLREHGLTRRVRAAITHFSALPFLLVGTDAVATMPSHAARAIAAQGRIAASPAPLVFPQYAFGLSWRFDAMRNGVVKDVRDVIISVFDTAPDTN